MVFSEDALLSASYIIFGYFVLTVGGGINIKAVKSPMRLLFGAAESPARPSTSRSVVRDGEVDRLGSTDSVFEVISLPAPTNKRGYVFQWFSDFCSD